MRYLIFITALLFAVSCETKDKISVDEINAYEQEMKEKIKAAKIEIGKMRFELEKLNDSLQTDLNAKINQFDQKLDDAEKSFRQFKNVQEKEIWTKRKTQLDSLLGHLKLKIDTTSTNINQMIKDI